MLTSIKEHQRILGAGLILFLLFATTFAKQGDKLRGWEKKAAQVCPKPRKPADGRVEVESKTYKVGDVIHYKCKLGFTMLGLATRECQENGQWSGQMPTCRKLCSFPIIQNREGLTMTENPGREDTPKDAMGNVILSEIEFSCQSGYSMDGPSKIRCLSGGTWDQEPPVCEKSNSIHCPDPGEIQNGVMQPKSASSYPTGTSVQFQCNDGFVLSGQPLITCSEAGQWSSPVPSCMSTSTTWQPPKITSTTPNRSKVVCEDPPELLHGSFKITLPTSGSNRPDVGHTINTSIKYECHHPYILDGNDQRFCLATGTWSGTEPVCRPDCGKGVEPKVPQVVGGTVAEQHGYPWQVALTTYRSRAEFRVIHCGGVVLHERWVLTAAHCITNQSSTDVLPPEVFLLLFGKHYADRNIDNNDVLSRKVSQLIVHPSYNPWSLDGDLGLVHLESAIFFNNAIVPLCLPSTSSLVTFEEGRVGVVAGWGYTDRNQTEAPVLMRTELPLVSNAKCAESYKKHRFQVTVTENMFCAGLDEGGKSTCQGDSGGAMAFLEKGRYILEGIVSWGNKDDCAAPGSYAGFVRVRNYVPWIRVFVP